MVIAKLTSQSRQVFKTRIECSHDAIPETKENCILRGTSAKKSHATSANVLTEYFQVRSQLVFRFGREVNLKNECNTTET